MQKSKEYNLNTTSPSV